ncbi:lipoprotein insertase outer membrane protein LolB [Thalassotalea euphylliae]|uniref:lipoprotein insertase outer membrane protein LolB n=1 Tax=Thalassotalea euphylliae TaxID=1655234 RepID=UPI00362907F8
MRTLFPRLPKHTVFDIKRSIAGFFLLLLSACSQTPKSSENQTPTVKSPEIRESQLLQVTTWQIKGQIAFLQEKKREKANINWQANETNQKLSLTTYLGINVLSMEKAGDIFTVEVDGETYKTTDLDRLVWQLTGLTLPSEAMSFWIKAIPYSSQDTVAYHSETGLPESITSIYDNREWKVTYKGYQVFSGHYLPGQLLIKQNNFTIKLAIKNWQVET